MKQYICLMLALVLLCGCQAEAQPLQDPVRLYYRAAAEKGGVPQQIMAPKLVEGAGRREDPTDLLNDYLLAAPGEGYQQTFPAGTRVIKFELDQNKAFITVSASLATFDGIRLTLACACLTKTVMELTGAECVYIRAHNETLAGSEQLMMDADTLLTLDLSPESAE